MPTTRAGFIKTLMAGIAAAPLATKGGTHKHVSKPGNWQEKHWTSGGLSFSEYTLPITIPPVFEEANNRQAHRMLWIPIFDRDVEKKSLRDIVTATIEATGRRADAVKRHGMPIVDEDGKELNYGTPDELKHITLVKIQGHKALIGVLANANKMVPITDFYRDIASRNNRVKRGMGRMEADYSQEVNLTDKEKGARNQENEGGWRRRGATLPIL
jgi:hypothetical protein